MRGPLPALLTMLVLFVFVTSARDYTDSRGVLSAIADAPAKFRGRRNPYEGQPDAVAAGEKLFRQHCAECHGDDARGRRHAADLRAPAVQGATAGELEWFLRAGNLPKGMPSWSGIPEQRRWQIVTYLKHLVPAPMSDAAIDEEK